MKMHEKLVDLIDDAKSARLDGIPTSAETFYKLAFWFDGTDWKPVTDKQCTWSEFKPFLEEMKTFEAMEKLRDIRNHLLAATDWMAVSDRTMSDKEKEYRQALRDLPKNSPDATIGADGALTGVTFPKEP